MIEARINCPRCERELCVEDLASVEAVECPCGWSGRLGADAIDDGRIVRCPLCGTEDLYVQKDFPERLGIAVVVIGLVVATIFWANYSWIGTIGTLFVFGAFDWILFHTRKDVTVCYRCLAQFRNMTPNPAHRAFDLGIGEKYRQERIRKEQMRREQTAKQAAAASGE